MKLNTQTVGIKVYTHEGAVAYPHLTPEQKLRRLVMACLLWEDNFYIDGKSHADLIREIVPLCDPEKVARIAVEARSDQHLRHVPLLLVREMARYEKSRKLVARTLEAVIQRPDELAEFMMIYDPKYGRGTAGKGEKLAAQVKKGLAAAFAKFNEYSLAKYNRDSLVLLKDVLFLSHAKPKDGAKGLTRTFRKMASPGELEARLSEGGLLYKKLVEGKMATPDTWEVSLSGGTDKKESFTRLITEKKLGALALLRNLRNMKDAGIEKGFVAEALAAANYSRVLPFRFIAAARAVPDWEDVIEPAMFRAVAEIPKLKGKTVFIGDVSGSMSRTLSSKSDMTRSDAMCGVAILARELCDDVTVIAYSDLPKIIAPRRGFALRDAITSSMYHGNTRTSEAVEMANNEGYDRVILVTDEQSHPDARYHNAGIRDPLPGTKAYAVNVAVYQNGVGYGKWTHVDGFSEAIFKYIAAVEAEVQIT